MLDPPIKSCSKYQHNYNPIKLFSFISVDLETTAHEDKTMRPGYERTQQLWLTQRAAATGGSSDSHSETHAECKAFSPCSC